MKKILMHIVSIVVIHVMAQVSGADNKLRCYSFNNSDSTFVVFVHHSFLNDSEDTLLYPIFGNARQCDNLILFEENTIPIMYSPNCLLDANRSALPYGYDNIVIVKIPPKTKIRIYREVCFSNTKRKLHHFIYEDIFLKNNDLVKKYFMDNKQRILNPIDSEFLLKEQIYFYAYKISLKIKGKKWSCIKLAESQLP